MMYIGSTNNLISRIGAHFGHNNQLNLRYDMLYLYKVHILKVCDERLLSNYESLYILDIQPILNKGLYTRVYNKNSNKLNVKSLAISDYCEDMRRSKINPVNYLEMENDLTNILQYGKEIY